MSQALNIIQESAKPHHAVGQSSAAMVTPSLVHALLAAADIKSHRDFYSWLQGEVQHWLPHHTLISCWGDFERNNIGVDITSSLRGVSTQALAGRPEFDLAIKRLHAYVRVDALGSAHSLLRGVDLITSVCGNDLPDDFYALLGRGAHALLVHAMRCERTGHDALYVFVIDNPNYFFDPVAHKILMPALDRALRTIKCLQMAVDEVAKKYRERLDLLSSRESEVVEWVSQGKSNEEIGAILGISHNTVKNHLKHIFAKMSVTARSQAVHVYMQGKLQAGH